MQWVRPRSVLPWAATQQVLSELSNPAIGLAGVSACFVSPFENKKSQKDEFYDKLKTLRRARRKQLDEDGIPTFSSRMGGRDIMDRQTHLSCRASFCVIAPTTRGLTMPPRPDSNDVKAAHAAFNIEASSQHLLAC